MENEILSILNETIELKENLKKLIPLIVQITNKIIKAYKSNRKVVLFGNGGSAADAQHIAAEFVGKFYKDRPSLPALAFHTNTSVITATANDYGYDFIFERQVSSLVNEGDIVIGISTSGNSPNVIKGLNKAKEKGAITIGFTGKKENKMEKIVDYCLKIPSTDTPRIQEGHITVGHIICYLVEKELFHPFDLIGLILSLQILVPLLIFMYFIFLSKTNIKLNQQI